MPRKPRPTRSGSARSGLRRILDEAAGPAHYAPQVPFETTSLTRMRELVARGLGIALLPRSIAQAPGPAITIHPVRPTPIQRSIAVIHHRDHRLTPAAEACREHLINWTGAADAPASRAATDSPG